MKVSVLRCTVLYSWARFTFSSYRSNMYQPWHADYVGSRWKYVRWSWKPDAGFL